MSDILIVDDERDIRELISEILIDEGYKTRLAGTSEECLKELRESAPGLLILDIWLKDSDMDGIDILKKAKRDYPNVPVVIISGHGNIEIAVAAIKQGAYDFIEKPFNIDQLLVVIRRAMEISNLRRENIALKQKDNSTTEMIGSSAAYKGFLAQLDKVSKTNGRVMLHGALGSGKETAARYIHANSQRKDKPFISINCSALDPEYIDNTLFGHDGVGQSDQFGLIEKAHGGVLFLNEVSDLPLIVQAKLLRVLVEQKLQRIGSNEYTSVDLRVISSSSRDLNAAIEAKTFREELFHRLNVVPIHVPSIEERREDIPELFSYFVNVYHETQKLIPRTLSNDAAALLQTMPWPGNVRQLKNLVERILILGNGTGEISVDEIPNEITSTDDSTIGSLVNGPITAMPLREAREAFEREYLIAQIGRFGGNISKTANFVGMERSALHRKLKSLGVVSSGRSTMEDVIAE